MTENKNKNDRKQKQCRILYQQLCYLPHSQQLLQQLCRSFFLLFFSCSFATYSATGPLLSRFELPSTKWFGKEKDYLRNYDFILNNFLPLCGWWTLDPIGAVPCWASKIRFFYVYLIVVLKIKQCCINLIIILYICINILHLVKYS